MKNIRWKKLNEESENQKDEREEFTEGQQQILIHEIHSQNGKSNLNYWNPATDMICYYGLCNFRWTVDEFKELSLMDGVEGLKPLTAYRFLLGINPLFDEDSVKNNIEARFCGQAITDNQGIVEQIADYMTAGNNTEFYVFPDGKVVDTSELEYPEELTKLSGGIYYKPGFSQS